MSSKKDIIKETGKYTISTIVGKLLSLPYTIVVAKFLGPSMLGIFALYQLIISYASYSQLGQLQSLSRQIPIAYGNNDNNKVENIKNILFSSYAITTLLALFIVFIIIQFDLIMPEFFNSKNTILIIFTLFFSQTCAFLRNYIKAEGQFYILANFDIIEKIIRPILGIILIIQFGITGALINLLIMLCITFLYYAIKVNNRTFIFKLNLQETIKLVKPGLLIFISKIAGSLFWNIDLIIIGILMAKSDVGFYSLSLNLFIALGVFSRAISMHMYRKILLKSSDNAPIQEKYNFIMKNNSLYMLYITIIFGSATLVYTSLIDTILMEYKPAKLIIVLINFGYIVFISRNWFSYYLDATNQLIKRFVIILFGLFINIILDVFLIKSGYGLLGVSTGCIIGFFVISFPIIFISISQIKESKIFAVVYLLRHLIVTALLSILIYHFSFNNLINQLIINELNQYYIYIVALINLAMELIIFALLSIVLYSVFYKDDNIVKKISTNIKLIFSN